MQSDDRPLVTESFHTSELPSTPHRDRTLRAHLWLDAPEEPVRLGQDISEPFVSYKAASAR